MPLSSFMEKELAQISALPQVYEVGFHLIPTVAEEDLGALVTAVRDSIESAGGRMISDEYPKQMELAYPMVKVVSNKRATYQSSYFGWMKFEVEPKGALLIDASLKQNPSVIRFLLLKTVRENTMAPKKILRERRTETVLREPEKVVEKPELTEEEIEKTIEDLVIN